MKNASLEPSSRHRDFDPFHSAAAAARHDDIGDLICLSHLRWDFVYQRPQHLLSRCAKGRRVFFFEEPIFWDRPASVLDLTKDGDSFVRAVPRLPRSLSPEEAVAAQRQLLDQMLREHSSTRYSLWYYTPMAVPFTRHLAPQVVVYDCMDELSLFQGAPPALARLEEELFRLSDLVFTGGQTLYEFKRQLHENVHAFPSSVDTAHFAMARNITGAEPSDQAKIGGPRFGFFGVIDERMDIELIRSVATMRPTWQFVLIGPVVKINAESLPALPNVHYLGTKSYDELPKYLAGWDIAMLPFARNDATRFISPTKTPEYLAAGKRVISTSIRDVVTPYGTKGLVTIADDPETFIAEAEQLLTKPSEKLWQSNVEKHLSSMSWDKTWTAMHKLIAAAAKKKALPRLRMSS